MLKFRPWLKNSNTTTITPTKSEDLKTKKDIEEIRNNINSLTKLMEKNQEMITNLYQQKNTGQSNFSSFQQNIPAL